MRRSGRNPRVTVPRGCRRCSGQGRKIGALAWCGRADTGLMLTGGLVAHVEHVLERGHALFGEPSAAGARLCDSGWGLAGVGERLRAAHAQMNGLTGALPARYTRFASDALQAIEAAAGTDAGLRNRVRAAGRAEGAGATTSAAVINGAATDTAALAPKAHTPAGQRALIAALHARLAQQQRVINTYQARDRKLAAVVASLRYSRHAAMGVMPMGAPPFGGAGCSASPSSVLSGRSGLAGAGRAGRDQHAALVDWRGDPRGVAVEPGIDAAKAALRKVGCPYVWGAKGPNRFDCSGLTQWAWRQAGVTLGADTYAQIRDGIAVPAGEVRPGDLIFPLDSFGRAGPGHVQLAISDHQVVHAPTAGDVVRVAAMPAHYIARRPLRTSLV
jgi:peptidoglycan DL-endopeptidase CwlO